MTSELCGEKNQQVTLAVPLYGETVVKDCSQTSHSGKWSIPFHSLSRDYRRSYKFMEGSSVFCFANVEIGVPVETACTLDARVQSSAVKSVLTYTSSHKTAPK